MKTILHFIKSFVLIYLISFGLSNSAYTQDRKVDVLQKLYTQGNFKRILKKANKLTSNTKYKKNAKVYLFKSLALKNLKDDSRYTYRHANTAKEYARSVKKYQSIDPKLVELHKFTSNNELLSAYSLLGNTKKSKTKNNIESVKEHKTHTDIKKDKTVKSSNANNKNEIISYAETFIGTPYVYGGNNEKGFDCSGFTSHVMKTFDRQLPRSARDQYKAAKPIKLKDAVKGDLVFFGKSKNNITHVGIVTSNKGEELSMIHASSSRGIMFTNIEKDVYWKPKLIGVGRIDKK